MMEEYNSNDAIRARLAFNVCLILLIGFLGYLLKDPWVLLGLLFVKKTTLTPDDIEANTVAE